MLKQNIIDEKDINYIEKPVTEMLIQTTNDFSNI
jgi:hypothetical protein